jgi:hypothetical protein
MLEPMFMAANRPFYQSSELMYLNKIDEQDYRSFISGLFGSGNRKIEDNSLSDIFNWTRLHTFYVQYVCNLLPAHQYKLLQALAVEGGIQQPTSAKFIKAHDLTAASSVTTSLKALAEKEMIIHDGTCWQVYDVFFSRWLEYHYG